MGDSDLKTRQLETYQAAMVWIAEMAKELKVSKTEFMASAVYRERLDEIEKLWEEQQEKTQQKRTTSTVG